MKMFGIDTININCLFNIQLLLGLSVGLIDFHLHNYS